MSDFLAFLNSADAETLTKTPGITHALAEGLIAARPFASVDDCLKVRGMGPNLLARLQSAFEAQGNADEGRAVIPVEEEAPPAPLTVESPKSAPPPAEAGPSFGTRFNNALLSFLRGLVRLIAVLILAGALGALVYFGLPYLRDNYVRPVEQNLAEVARLRSEMQAVQSQNATLEARLNETDKRLTVLEQSIEQHSTSLAKLADMQTALEKSMAAGDAKLSKDMEAANAQLLADLKREIMLTRSIEYLSRARLYLSQSNFGLARDDVQAARGLLAGIQTDNPAFKVEAMQQVTARLDLALGNLPAFPVVAVGDVDIALQLLMSDLPEPTPAPTTTPTAVPTITPEWTTTPEASPTPVPTATP